MSWLAPSLLKLLRTIKLFHHMSNSCRLSFCNFALPFHAEILLNNLYVTMKASES